jgi:aldehyde dehydrogenase (NAD+)
MDGRGAGAEFADEPGELLIDGTWRRPADGAAVELRSPVDGSPLTRVAAAGVADVKEAVGAARRAFDEGEWPRMSGHDRAQILYDAADLVEQATPWLTRCQAVEMGKPVRFGLRDDGPFAASALRYFAAMASQGAAFGQPATASTAAAVLREPCGVVAALSDFHHPLAMAASLVVPALAAGDTVVLKPSAAAPLCVLAFARLCAAAGLPAGVLNVVTGDDAELPGELVAQPGVDRAAYVGGIERGRQVAMACAGALVPVTLDLARRHVHMVFADACLEHAARQVAPAVLPGRSEFRGAGARILVHADVYAVFCDVLAARVSAFTPADPRDPATWLGPLARREDFDRLTGFLASIDGHRAAAPPRLAAQGLFHPATLSKAVDARIAARLPEVFAPLVFVIPFRTEHEAVALANDGRAQLSLAVHTPDLGTARRVADAVRAETCRISTCATDGPLEPEDPGECGEPETAGPLREFGVSSLDPYTRAKAIWTDVPG